jgi:hypothetical protein
VEDRRQLDNACAMIRYECHMCSMTATCVDNDVSRGSWLDHMACHADSGEFSAWTWNVLKLELFEN